MSAPPVSVLRRPPSRRRRRRRVLRTAPLLLAAVAAFGAGAVMGSGAGEDVAARYAAAWGRGDFAGMHALLTPGSARRWPFRLFLQEHRRAAATATLDVVSPAGPAAEEGSTEVVPVRLRTESFGTLEADLRLPVEEVDGESRVRWGPHLAFPGLRPGEDLRRQTSAPPRADLLARDGTVLARGPQRTGQLDPLAAEVVGRVGPIPPERARDYEGGGYAPDAIVGLSGLELHFEERLRGRLGGRLRGGGRVLARTAPRQAEPVRTSIDVRVQQAAVAALAGRLGGVAVVRPRTGEVLALAGLATAAPQPPGSTFKIVTLAGALEAGVVRPRATFPVATSTTLEGVEIENAHGESCGGSLSASFAHSCNSVFAPMGAALGAERLVSAAERFGFNEDPGVAGASIPTIPAADEIGDELAVGASAIGQGRLLTTPLHQAAVAAAIANGGTYVSPTLERGGRGQPRRATPRRVARTIAGFMRRVVTEGTGVGARIEGVRVAGKTGTAELRDTTPEPEELGAGEEPVPEDDVTDTTAWFVAYAPAGRPRAAVAVMLVGAGAGGDTAAPAARQVLLAALRRG